MIASGERVPSYLDVALVKFATLVFASQRETRSHSQHIRAGKVPRSSSRHQSAGNRYRLDLTLSYMALSAVHSALSIDQLELLGSLRWTERVGAMVRVCNISADCLL